MATSSDVRRVHILNVSVCLESRRQRTGIMANNGVLCPVVLVWTSGIRKSEKVKAQTKLAERKAVLSVNCEHDYGNWERMEGGEEIRVCLECGDVDVNESSLQDWQRVSFADGDYYEPGASGEYRMCVYETSAGHEQGYCGWQIEAWDNVLGWYCLEKHRQPLTVDVAYNQAKRQLNRYESGEIMPGDA